MPQFQNSSLSQNGNDDIEYNSEMKIYLERLISPQIFILLIIKKKNIALPSKWNGSFLKLNQNVKTLGKRHLLYTKKYA